MTINLSGYNIFNMQSREKDFFSNRNPLYDSRALGVLKFTSKIQKESGGRYLETGGLIKGLSVDPVIEKILKDLGVDPQDIWKKVDEKMGFANGRVDEARETIEFFSKDDVEPKFYKGGKMMSDGLKNVLFAARKSCEKRGSCEITSLDLLAGVVLSGKGFAYEALKELGIGRIDLLTRIRKEQGLNPDPEYQYSNDLHSSPGLKTRVGRLIKRGYKHF